MSMEMIEREVLIPSMVHEGLELLAMSFIECDEDGEYTVHGLIAGETSLGKVIFHHHTMGAANEDEARESCGAFILATCFHALMDADAYITYIHTLDAIESGEMDEVIKNAYASKHNDVGFSLN